MCYDAQELDGMGQVRICEYFGPPCTHSRTFLDFPFFIRGSIYVLVDVVRNVTIPLLPKKDAHAFTYLYKSSSGEKKTSLETRHVAMWKETALHILRHARPGKLDLHLMCDATGDKDHTSAVVQPLLESPGKLKHCKLRLAVKRNTRLSTLLPWRQPLERPVTTPNRRCARGRSASSTCHQSSGGPSWSIRISSPRTGNYSGAQKPDSTACSHITAAAWTARGSLTLVVHLSTTTHAVYSDQSGLLQHMRKFLYTRGPALLSVYAQLLWPLWKLRRSKRLFVQLEPPWNYSPHGSDYISSPAFGGVGARARRVVRRVEVQLEKLVMGDAYDSYAVGKGGEELSDWLAYDRNAP